MRICVEGNISSGKSTCLQHVKETVPEASVFFEPLHEWERWLDNMKEMFGGLAMQMGVLATFMGDAKDRHNVFERGPFACTQVFSHTCLEEPEMKLFEEVVGHMSVWRPDHVIYVAVPPDECRRRMLRRGRRYEQHDVAFMVRLGELYDKAISRLMERHPEGVTIVDGNRDRAVVAQDVADVVHRLLARDQNLAAAVTSSLGSFTTSTSVPERLGNHVSYAPVLTSTPVFA